MKKLTLLLSIMSVIVLICHGLSSAEKPTALFLVDTEPGTRLYSMGGIFSSVSSQDAFYSPWSLGWTVNSGASFSLWPGVVEGSRYNFGGVISPYIEKLGTFNLSYLNYGTGEETIEELDGTTRTIKLEGDTLISIGYGTGIGQKIFIGGKLKYLSSTLAEEYRATSILSDLGILYHSLNDKHSIGISLNNFGMPITYYKIKQPLPTEMKIGYTYKFKLIANHKLLVGASFGKVLRDVTQTISAGVEYFPGISFVSVRAGLRKREDMQYTGGLGINFKGLDLDIGYGISTSNLESTKVPLRFSLNWLFGPRDEYSIAETYLKKRNMRDKALALWENILPSEKQYADAQEAIKLHMYPPELVVTAELKDETGDGLLGSDESGSIMVNIANKGKSKAINIRTEIMPADLEEVFKTVHLGSYEKRVEILDSGQNTNIAIPVRAFADVKKIEVEFEIRVTEGRNFNPQPARFFLATEGFEPPVIVLAKYTFREDNTGYSIGNGNGVVEKGEQIELTGYVINAGECPARDVVAEITSSDRGVEILSQISKVNIGTLKAKEWRKVVFGLKIFDDYTGPEQLPVKIELTERRPKYSRTQPIEISLGKFYQDPIQLMVTDVDLSPALASLPPLAGPIPGTKVKELIRAKAGVPPCLEFDAKMLPDDNKNNIYEPGEQLALQVGIRNTGEGTAKAVTLVLSGDETVVSLLGESTEIGDIEPGRFQPVMLKSVIPDTIPRKEAVFKIQVVESRGFSPATTPEMRVALMPKEIKVVKELPKLVPWPDVYKEQRPNAGAVVIGISDYQTVDKLKYARKDAELVTNYLNGVLGIPWRNMKEFFDDKATKSRIETATKDWLAKKDFDFMVFYFAGHGVPDPEDPRTGEPYIIPYDGDLELGKGTLVSLNELVAALEESKAKDVFVVFDACFSGAGGRTPQLLAQRGIAIVPKFEQKRAIVLSATSETQPSLEFEKVEHGYFTYYFLLGLKGEADKDKDGWVDLPELYEFVKTSLDYELEGKQTPTCSNLTELNLGKYK
jgi:hypothetical protein